ncbi:Alpha/Beta hydrolase protein [Tirmania nivea]|nr:Alpha/Beta hydrolase protein [Tirmania nivea]
MPRVPFVGRLHLYLPPFRARTSEEFHTPEENTIGFDFTAHAPTLEAGSSSDGSSIVTHTYSRELERERLFYKFKEEEEKRRAEKQRKSRWTIRWFKDEANAFLSSSVPLWRRNSQEYVALVVSFCFLILESFIRVITIALRMDSAATPLETTPVIHFFYQRSRTLFNALSPASHTTKSSTRKEKNVVAQIREADGFVELCAVWKYEAEEHIVQTKDGYLLGLHRVRPKGSSEKRGRERTRGRGRRNFHGEDAGKRVVYMHHGLMMNSEIWVCLTEKKRCLPFVLVDAGYDVWLGNNRGNKYSKKCIHHSSSDPTFWDFSMDQFAIHDIPDAINYILDTTKSKSLSYIGFSQGTAQAFASLSIHPSLNEKVDVFIALAPAMSPAGLHNPIVDAFIKASPNLLYLLFGRKSILSSATFWQSLLYPPIFVRLIDSALTFLFNWRGVNITLNQKLAAYAHLYSYTSTKSVVHWFQIIRNKSFQMYDDDVHAQSVMNMYGNTFYRVARFPTKNITTPIVLVWGGSDSLVDIRVMLKELPGHTVDIGIPHYEHLDMLWAQDVDKLVFPTVLSSLQTYSYSCEGEEDEYQHVLTRARAKSVDAETKSIPQLMVHKGSAGFSQNKLSSNPPATSRVLPSYSDDERNAMTGTSMGEADGAAASANSENRMNIGTIPGTTHGMRPTSSGSLGIVTEETPSQVTSPRPSEAHQITESTGSKTSSQARRQSPNVIRRSQSPLDHKRLSLDSVPPPPTINAFKEFFSNPSLFTRKLRGRSASVSSTTSNVSASASSVKSGENTSDNGGRSATKFIPRGIVLPRPGAAVAVSTESTIEGLDEAERQRQKRLRRERGSS